MGHTWADPSEEDVVPSVFVEGGVGAVEVFSEARFRISLKGSVIFPFLFPAFQDGFNIAPVTHVALDGNAKSLFNPGGWVAAGRVFQTFGNEGM